MKKTFLIILDPQYNLNIDFAGVGGSVGITSHYLGRLTGKEALDKINGVSQYHRKLEFAYTPKVVKNIRIYLAVKPTSEAL